MTKSELALLIAEFIMTEKETVMEAIEKEDIDLLQNEAYEYLDNCD